MGSCSHKVHQRIRLTLWLLPWLLPMLPNLSIYLVSDFQPALILNVWLPLGLCLDFLNVWSQNTEYCFWMIQDWSHIRTFALSELSEWYHATPYLDPKEMWPGQKASVLTGGSSVSRRRTVSEKGINQKWVGTSQRTSVCVTRAVRIHITKRDVLFLGHSPRNNASYFNTWRWFAGEIKMPLCTTSGGDEFDPGNAIYGNHSVYLQVQQKGTEITAENRRLLVPLEAMKSKE